MDQRYFTVAEANKALAIVKPITKDIIDKRMEMIEIKKIVKTIKESDLSEESIYEAIDELSIKLKEVSKKITYHLEELEMVGCYLKDFQEGIINFPSVLNGRVVFLYWDYSKPEVNHWHEITSNELQLITK